MWPKGKLYGQTISLYNDQNIFRKLLVNETVETPVISTCMSVECLELKTYRMSNKLLHTESAERYLRHIQVKMEYYYIGKGYSRWRN
jgi:hypothetical protein